MPACNILVAGADAAVCTVAGQALARAGYEVRTAGTASKLSNSLQLRDVGLDAMGRATAGWHHCCAQQARSAPCIRPTT